jgi:predicted nucleic acid-binding protein
MNQEYISSLERTIHQSKFHLVKADNIIKELGQKTKLMKNALYLSQNENLKLHKKLEFEKEKYVCNVCYQNQKDCIIQPCRHFAGCKLCCEKLNTCPICRTEIKSYITLFIP